MAFARACEILKNLAWCRRWYSPQLRLNCTSGTVKIRGRWCHILRSRIIAWYCFDGSVWFWIGLCCIQLKFVFGKQFSETEGFKSQTLTSYPVERSRLDAFIQLLIRNKAKLAVICQIELTAMILLLVTSNKGVSVLHHWVVREVKYSSDY